MSEWILILSMAVITFSIRYVLLAASGRWRLPAPIERSLNYVPVAVLSAIVVQTIMVKDRVTAGSWTINPGFLFAAVVAFIIARFTKSLMISVIAGLAAYWLFILWAG